MTLQVSASGVLYVAMLTLLAAAVIGVIPALKATGAQVLTRVQTLSAGSGSRMQMGRVWTTLIVAQVVVTVAVLPVAMFHAWTALRFRTGDAGFASAEFLTAQLALDHTTFAPTDAGEHEFTARFAVTHRELERRLEEEAVISEVTFSMADAGDELAAVAEIEGREAPADLVDYNIVAGTERGHLVRFNRILAGLFSRVLGQLALGAALGLLGAIGLEQLLEGEMFQRQGAVIVPVVVLLMTTVGVLAAIEPARQGLSIQPTEALREE